MYLEDLEIMEQRAKRAMAAFKFVRGESVLAATPLGIRLTTNASQWPRLRGGSRSNLGKRKRGIRRTITGRQHTKVTVDCYRSLDSKVAP